MGMQRHQAHSSSIHMLAKWLTLSSLYPPSYRGSVSTQLHISGLVPCVLFSWGEFTEGGSRSEGETKNFKGKENKIKQKRKGRNKEENKTCENKAK